MRTLILMGANAVAVFAFVVFMAGVPAMGQPLLEDVSATVGLNHVGTCGGVFWYDYDNDGDQDLLHSYRFGGTTVIYRNDGASFTALTNIGFSSNRDAGKTIPMDFDHDGDLDIWLDQYGTSCQLMVNEGGTFVDRTAQLGIPSLSGGREFTWIDINRDGWMDILFCSPTSWTLLRNEGGTHFTDITSSAELPDLYELNSFAEADIDLDGDMDLFSVRIGESDRFYLNYSNGVFVDATAAAGLGNTQGNSGCAWVDFDHDKYPDLLTQAGDHHGIWHNNGDGTFTPMIVHGTETESWGGFPYGAQYAVADFDMDGDYDIYAVRPGGWGEGLAPNQFFRQDMIDGLEIWFTDIAPELGMDFMEDGYASWVDYDGDGDLDLYLSRQNAADRLFRNNTLGAANCLQVRALGPNGEQDRWHTRVEVYPHGQSAALASSQLTYTNVDRNGLNNYFVLDPEAAYDLRVYFSCGVVMTPENCPQLSNVVPSQIGRLLTVHMMPLTVPPGQPVAAEFRLDGAYPNPFNSSTVIRFAIRNDAQVRLSVYDVLGRHVADLVNASLTAGPHEAVWNASGLPSGIYLLRLRTENDLAVQKAVLLK
jgi:hypothetical protein